MRTYRIADRARIACAVIARRLGNGFIAALRTTLWPRRRPLRAERICIYRIGAIVDLICATTAMFAIRRAYPQAHLTLLTTPGKYRGARHAEELLGAAGWIDEIISYDLGEIGSIPARLEFAGKLRAHKFDLWFDLTLDRARFSRMLRGHDASAAAGRALGLRMAPRTSRLCGAGGGRGQGISR